MTTWVRGRPGHRVGRWPGTGSHVLVRPLHPVEQWRQWTGPGLCFRWGSVGLLGCPHKSVLVGKDCWIIQAQLIHRAGVESSRGHSSQTQHTNQWQQQLSSGYNEREALSPPGANTSAFPFRRPPCPGQEVWSLNFQVMSTSIHEWPPRWLREQ